MQQVLTVLEKMATGAFCPQFLAHENSKQPVLTDRNEKVGDWYIYPQFLADKN